MVSKLQQKFLPNEMEKMTWKQHYIKMKQNLQNHSSSSFFFFLPCKFVNVRKYIFSFFFLILGSYLPALVRFPLTGLIVESGRAIRSSNQRRERAIIIARRHQRQIIQCSRRRIRQRLVSVVDLDEVPFVRFRPTERRIRVIHLRKVPVCRLYLHRRSVLLDPEHLIEARRSPGIDRRRRECPNWDPERRPESPAGTGERREI